MLRAAPPDRGGDRGPQVLPLLALGSFLLKTLPGCKDDAAGRGRGFSIEWAQLV